MSFLKFKKLYLLLLIMSSGIVGFSYWTYSKILSMSNEEISKYIKDSTNLEVTFSNKSVSWKILSIDLELEEADIQFADNLDIQEGTIDAAILSFNVLKSMVNMKPILETVSILMPKVLISDNNEESSDKKDVANKKNSLPIFDQEGIVKIFQKIPEIRKINVLNAQLILEKQDNKVVLFNDANIEITNIPGTSAHTNRIIKLKLSTEIDPKVITENVISNHLKPISIIVNSRTEYIQHNPINTNIYATIKNIKYDYDDLKLDIDEVGADIKWIQRDNEQEIEFSSIHILKDSKKLDLDDLSIKSEINKLRLLLSVRGNNLPIHTFLPFLGVKNEEIILSNHSFNFSNAILSNINLSTKIEDMQMKDTKLMMRLSNIEIDDLKSELKYKLVSADLDMSNNNYDINLLDGHIFLPAYICRHTLKTNRVSGKFNLNILKDKTKLNITEMQSKICGIQLKANGTVNFETKKSPVLDITSEFEHKDVSLLLQDVTDEYIDADLLKWLKVALPSQSKVSGDLAFKGILEKFPFEKNDGLFRINAYMNNVTFDFDSEWERLRHANVMFNVLNNVYKIKLNKGFLGDAAFGEASTSFSGSSELEDIMVDLRLNAKLEAIIKYLLRSPIKESVPSQKHFFLSGTAIANMKLRVPLEEHVSFELDGSARLENGAIFNKKTNRQMSNSFIGNMSLKKGDVSVDKFDPATDKNLYLKIKGLSKVDLRKPKVKAHLKYNANVSMNYKYVDDNSWRWLMKADFNNQRHSISGIEENELIALSSFRVNGKYSNDTSDFKLVGQNDLSGTYLNDSNVDKNKIKITLKKCNHSYVTLYSYIMDSLALDTGKSLHEKSIRFELEDLDIYSNVFNRINADATFKDDNMIFIFEDKGNKGGMVYYPKQGNWLLDFSTMTFARNSQGLSFDSFMYENHANFKANIGKLKVNGKNLGKLEIVYNPRLEQKVYEVKGDELVLSENDDDINNFSMMIFSNNFSNFLKEFDLSSKIVSKSGEIELKIKWPLNKQVIKFNDIYGSLNMNLDDGELYIGNGLSGGKKNIGRLISLMNVATLPRRLTLDFKDLTSSNLAFDKLEGKIKLKAGHYTTEDFEIVTTSAKFNINGELDYNRSTVDFDLFVMPNLTGGVPIVAAIAGGPVVGLAALAANTLIGDNINKLSIKKYKVSGSLDDLNIEEVKSKSKSTKK